VTRVAAAIAAVVMVVLGLPVAPAHAQNGSAPPAPPPAPPVGMHLVYQTPWVGTGGTFVMLLHVDNPGFAAAPSGAVSISVYQSADSRSAFDQEIAGTAPRGLLTTLNPIPLATAGHFGDNIAVGVPLRGSISGPGVYPVSVSLTNVGAPTTAFTTWLVVVNEDAPITSPLLVSWILPLVADPATLPDGAADASVVSQMQRGGRLDRVASVMSAAANPSRGKRALPFSALVGPETVESWTHLAAKDAALVPGIERTRAAARASTTHLLPTTYVPIAGGTLQTEGLGDLYQTQLLEGAGTLDNVLGAKVVNTAAFVDPADDATIDSLRNEPKPLTLVAVRDASLAPVPHDRTPAQSFALATAGGRSQGVATAPFVEQLLDGPDAAPLKAARVIAALAEVAYESPATPRGLVVAPPQNWSPDVAAMTTIFDTLRDFPLTRAVTLDNLFPQITTEKINGVDAERHLAPAGPPAGPLTAAEYDRASAQLDAYRAVAGDKDAATIAGERALLLAPSTSLSPDRAHAELATIDRAVTALTGAVKVDAARVTLTAKQVAIPVTFENKLRPQRPITVRVEFESDKLVFKDGAVQTLTLAPGVSTVRFKNVEVRASGTFPMTIRLRSADGRLSFGEPVKVTVRSAVFSGFAIALTIGALVFLLLWWGNHIRRTRRARRAPAVAIT
jgi:hypothetical protein